MERKILSVTRIFVIYMVVNIVVGAIFGMRVVAPFAMFTLFASVLSLIYLFEDDYIDPKKRNKRA